MPTQAQGISLVATSEQASNISVMASIAQKPASETTKWLRPSMPKIALTPASPTSEGEQQPVTISLSELIAYFPHTGHTRLVLSGRKNLQVKESTAQIDRLVRDAASQPAQP